MAYGKGSLIGTAYLPFTIAADLPLERPLLDCAAVEFKSERPSARKDEVPVRDDRDLLLVIQRIADTMGGSPSL